MSLALSFAPLALLRPSHANKPTGTELTGGVLVTTEGESVAGKERGGVYADDGAGHDEDGEVGAHGALLVAVSGCGSVGTLF